jgi:hypothetical protein
VRGRGDFGVVPPGSALGRSGLIRRLQLRSRQEVGNEQRSRGGWRPTFRYDGQASSCGRNRFRFSPAGLLLSR